MLFTSLQRDGWIDPAQVPSLQAMAGLRSVLVHGYQALDESILEDVVTNRLDDMVAFVDAIRTRLRA